MTGKIDDITIGRALSGIAGIQRPLQRPAFPTDRPAGPKPAFAPDDKGGVRPGQAGSGQSFADILGEAVKKVQPGAGELKFSAHAQARLAARNISITPADVERLKNAVDKAAAKGAKESLILMDSVAYVVSVKNRTVVTAVGGDSMKENVFTNIDSAVIV